jgi:hypothetical protein
MYALREPAMRRLMHRERDFDRGHRVLCSVVLLRTTIHTKRNSA